MAYSRKICAFVSLLMLIATTFGMMNVSAGPREPTHESNEIWFWDNFEDEVLTDKWDVTENPPIGEIGISGYTVSSNSWQSWFLESYWGILMKSVNVPGSVAYAASKPQYQILADYIISFNFTPIPSIPAPPYQPCGNFIVIEDGNVLLRIEGCSVPTQTAELYAYDGTRRVFIENLEWGKQYFFEIRAHITATPPTYDVYLKETYEGTFDFYSDPPVTLTRLTLGDDSGALDEYGEAAWDNIIVAELHDLPWTDDFDNLPAEIEDWTTIITPGNTFQPVIPSPPVPPAPSSAYALYMDESRGGVAYGFTPYFDIPYNANYYVVSFEFLYVSVTNRITVFSDGNIRLVFDTGNWLRAYIDESTPPEDITQLPNANQWYSIRCEIKPDIEKYFVFIDGADYGPFNFLENPGFRKAPSNLFLGDHVHSGTDGEAYWDYGKVTLNDPPELDWCGPPDYIDVGVYPDSGDTNTEFTYCVKYSDPDGDPPDPGPPKDPKVHINKGGVPYGSSPFSMALDSWVGSPNDYIAGALYIYSTYLIEGTDYTYYFTASDDKGLPAIPTTELDNPDVYPPNQPPTLTDCYVTPPVGRLTTVFYYYCTYTDLDNDPPAYMWVIIDSGSPIDMWEVLPSDVTYYDGKEYYYPTTLSLGYHDYRFEASDGHDVVLDPPSGEHLGPVVTTQSEPWWKYRHDEAQTGYSTSIAPSINNRVWQSSEGVSTYSSPAIIDGKVYIGGGDGLYKFDENTGELDWIYSTTEAVSGSSPAVANGRIFFVTNDMTLYSIDTDANYKWSFSIGLGTMSGILMSPTVVGDRVYVGSLSNKIYCLDADPSDHIDEGIDDPDGVDYDLIWEYETHGGFNMATPAVVDGYVYFHSNDGWLYKLDAVDGTWIWEYETGGGDSSPAVVDNVVYVGTWGGKVLAINAITYTMIWEQTVGPIHSSSPAIAYGRLFIGSTNGNVYALDINDYGKILWSYSTGDSVQSSVGVADNKIYFGSQDGYIYCLDIDRNFIWNDLISSGIGYILSSPGIADGIVFIGAEYLYAYA